MLSQATGRCFECHKLLARQTSSQICQGTPDIAGTFNQNSISYLIGYCYWKLTKLTACLAKLKSFTYK